MTPGELQEGLRVISIVVCGCSLNPNHTGFGLIQANYVSSITADALAPSHRQVISSHDVKWGCSGVPPQPALHHYNDVLMGTMASQITSLVIVYSSAYSGAAKKASKLRVTGLCEGNSPVIGDFPAQMASNAENGFIWWRHRVMCVVCVGCDDQTWYERDNQFAAGIFRDKSIPQLLMHWPLASPCH